MTRNRKRILLCAVGVLALLTIAGASRFLSDFYGLVNNPFNDRRFSEKEWKEFHLSDEPNNPRGRMAYDIRDHVLKTGMKRQDVLAILGQPDLYEGQEYISYNLGMWSGFRMDYDSLDIHFDEHGGFTHVRILQH